MARYASLLETMAYRYGASPDEQEDIVYDVLDDVLVSIRAHRVSEKTSLGPYLVSALRHLINNRCRNEEARQRAERAATEEGEGDGEAAVRSTCSEHAWRASRSPDGDEESRWHPAIERFHAFVASCLSAEDQEIAGWLADRVASREIAAWLSAPHGATRMRVSRMRQRTILAARRYVEGLADVERSIVERYLSGPRRAPRQDRGGDDAGESGKGANGDA